MSNAPPRPQFAPPRPPADFTELIRACSAAPGHFDELRAAASDFEASDADLTGAWAKFSSFFEGEAEADIDQRNSSIQRQVRDNGITYNVYANEDGPQRPWSLDLFPLILERDDWTHIQEGVQQRAQLLEHIMADVYGPQRLLHAGFLPPALVQGHPGYVRALHGCQPAGGRFLHITAFDLARGPDGLWWVVGQRVQAPSGLGYLLENRLAIGPQFNPAFEGLRVQRLAGTYRALMDSLRAASPMGAHAHLALLTPGPYNETYFEHAFLARYLGLTLVEGSDLVVRDSHVFLKTLKGLVPVHGLLKRVDDPFLDPLELRSDSTLGVPGLLQAIRAGHVLMANAPGAAFLESPALLGFLPAIAHDVLGQDLSLPALPTWWCGERSAMEEALAALPHCAIKATYPPGPEHTSFEAVLGRDLDARRLDARRLDEWAGRIVRYPEMHTVQEYLPLSQLPTWKPGRQPPLQAHSVMLRVFALADGARSWRVLPGGLARVAGENQEITSMQRGGSSADVWVLTDGQVDRTTLLQPHLTPEMLMQRTRVVTSRAAENLFWLGRYTERTENALRLARLTLEALHGEYQNRASLLSWLGRMAVANTLVLPAVPTPLQAPRVFERTLIDNLGSGGGATSVGFSLRAVKLAASSVRERLSQEHWRIIHRTEEQFHERFESHRRKGECTRLQALHILKDTSDQLAAITGAQTDRMTRDDGWRLLSIGRHIERLAFLAQALGMALQENCLEEGSGFDAVVDLFDSAITFHAMFQQSREMVALLDLLVIDRDNPRSIAWVAQTLRGRLAKLAGCAPQELCDMSHRVPDPGLWDLADMCESGPPGKARYAHLHRLLQDCLSAAYALSDEISTTYFTHSGQANRSVGGT